MGGDHVDGIGVVSTVGWQHSRDESMQDTGLVPQSLPTTFCNVSLPTVSDLGIRGPFEMSPEWEKRCFSPSFMPPMEFKWPGRNWCWVRTVERTCYPHNGEVSPPTWHGAQEAVAVTGFAPWPATEPFPAYINAEICDKKENGLPWIGLPQEVLSEAAKWVNDNVAIYVLNLDVSVDRWRAMREHAASLGIEINRIAGVDLRIQGAYDLAKAAGLVPKNYDYQKALDDARAILADSEMQGVEKFIDEMGLGTLGTAIAHIRAQREAHALAARAGKDLVLILEDDVTLTDGALVKLHYIINNEIPCDWDVFSLFTRCGFGQCVSPHVSREQIDGNEPDVRCHSSGSYGMYGMLYRRDSMPKISDLLQGVCFNNENPLCLPVDIALSSISDRIGYYAVPGSQYPGIVQEQNGGQSIRQVVSRSSLRPEVSKLDAAVSGKR
jgi:GR25 family glycosyltransferase involved in LPS biosynthesis